MISTFIITVHHPDHLDEDEAEDVAAELKDSEAIQRVLMNFDAAARVEDVKPEDLNLEDDDLDDDDEDDLEDDEDEPDEDEDNDHQ